MCRRYFTNCWIPFVWKYKVIRVLKVEIPHLLGSWARNWIVKSWKVTAIHEAWKQTRPRIGLRTGCSVRRQMSNAEYSVNLLIGNSSLCDWQALAIHLVSSATMHLAPRPSITHDLHWTLTCTRHKTAVGMKHTQGEFLGKHISCPRFHLIEIRIQFVFKP